jgi:hypothetical protein
MRQESGHHTTANLKSIEIPDNSRGEIEEHDCGWRTRARSMPLWALSARPKWQGSGSIRDSLSWPTSNAAVYAPPDQLLVQPLHRLLPLQHTLPLSLHVSQTQHRHGKTPHSSLSCPQLNPWNCEYAGSRQSSMARSATSRSQV